MVPFEPHLLLQADDPTNYYLNTHYSPKYKKEPMFGAVQLKKNYVSYHLFPVYVFPELLDSVSDALKKRMQGKACFNFTRIDAVLFSELAELTEKSFERFGRGVLA